MATVYANFLNGVITDNPLTFNATVIDSLNFAALPVVTSPNIMWLTLDPGSAKGNPEIAMVTNHASGSTVVTVIRGQQQTTARQHEVDTSWSISLTKNDMDDVYSTITSTIASHVAAPDPHTQYATDTDLTASISGRLVAWKAGTASGAALTATPLTVYDLTANLVAGRAYELKFQSRAGVGNAGTPYVHFTMVTSPVISGLALDTYVHAPTNYGSVQWELLVLPTVTGAMNFLIKADNSGGSGNVWVDGGCRIWISDIGPAVASS